MIPKKIHYCWFGRGEKPKLAKKCIESWKRYCPDFEIIEWNEDNFDVTKYAYSKYCFDNKKWAFLSDFVRLIVIYENGGIYFDTDVEVIKSLDNLLQYEAFYGFENDDYVATGLGFGSVSHGKTVDSILSLYLKLKPNSDGSFNLVNCPLLNTEGLLPFGLVSNGKCQKIYNAKIFSKEYFNPLNDATGQLNITKNTFTINHYGKSWMKKSVVIKSRLARPVRRLFNLFSKKM